MVCISNINVFISLLLLGGKYFFKIATKEPGQGLQSLSGEYKAASMLYKFYTVGLVKIMSQEY